MLSHDLKNGAAPAFDLGDVHKASEAKSFDYRASLL